MLANFFALRNCIKGFLLYGTKIILDCKLPFSIDWSNEIMAVLEFVLKFNIAPLYEFVVFVESTRVPGACLFTLTIEIDLTVFVFKTGVNVDVDVDVDVDVNFVFDVLIVRSPPILELFTVVPYHEHGHFV